MPSTGERISACVALARSLSPPTTLAQSRAGDGVLAAAGGWFSAIGVMCRGVCSVQCRWRH